MRIEIYFALGFLTLYKDAATVCAKSIVATDPSVEKEFVEYMNCSQVNSSSECLEITGRKKKGGSNGGGGSNVILVSSPGQTSHSTFEHPGHYEYIEIEEDDQGGKKGKRKGKKNKQKKKKGFYKKMKPLAYGLGGLKLILDHFLLKKLLFLSLFNFFLSKVSFILATLVALKQFFHNPGGHSRSESHKVEVVAIPFKKHKKHKDFFFDESKLVPITYANDLMKIPETTPTYFTYPSHGGFISSEEEAFNDLINDNNKEISAVNDEVEFMKKNNDFERSDTYNANHNEKTYYLNHVHSPFV